MDIFRITEKNLWILHKKQYPVGFGYLDLSLRSEHSFGNIEFGIIIA